MKVLFVVPHPPGESPSQRFRFEQYLPLLNDFGIYYSIDPFLTISHSQALSGPGGIGRKMTALICGFGRRFLTVFRALNYDRVFIHREATPIGPPIIEWILAKVFRKEVIFDFDDAIWLTDNKEEPPFISRLKWRSKVGSICQWAKIVSAGNNFLADYASQFNTNVNVIPTVVDTQSRHRPCRRTNSVPGEVVIGWTGSHSTLKYLQLIEHAMRKVESMFPHVRFICIADRPPNMSLSRLEFVRWSEKTEIEDLSRIDIGVMPLPDDDWARGKCGFKIIQYLSLEIASVASPVGVNSDIISHGVNGFLANGALQWIESLQRLIEDPELRLRLGQQGRQTIVTRYSVSSTVDAFVSLFAR